MVFHFSPVLPLSAFRNNLVIELLHSVFIIVLRHFLSRCGLRACPAARASSVPTATAHIIISVLRHFLSRCGLRACPAPRASNEPTAQGVYKLAATVRVPINKV